MSENTKTKKFIYKGIVYESEADRIRLFNAEAPDVLKNVVDKLNDSGFFTAPASTKYHGAYSCGLFDHSLVVTLELLALTEKLGLKWARPESPWIVGMLHDLCKVDLYVWDSDHYTYTEGGYINGHGDKSVILAQRLVTLTDEEIACIRWHMGAFETDPKMWTYYTNAVHKFANVLYTHTADMIASHIDGI